MVTASVHTCTVPCIQVEHRSRPKQFREVDTCISETPLGAVQLAEEVRQARTEFIGTDHILTLLKHTERISADKRHDESWIAGSLEEVACPRPSLASPHRSDPTHNHPTEKSAP
jgi:hypothetical protein